MKLKNGDKYVQINSGFVNKLIESNDIRWFLRNLDKEIRGDMCKMSAEEMEAMLEKSYMKKLD